MIIKKEEIFPKFGIELNKLYAKCSGIYIVTQLTNYDISIGIEYGMLCLKLKSSKLINPKILRTKNFVCAKLVKSKLIDSEEEFIFYYFKELSKIEKR